MKLIENIFEKDWSAAQKFKRASTQRSSDPFSACITEKTGLTLCALLFVSLVACSSPAPQILTSQNKPAFAPGEYVTAKRTVAAIDTDSFRLAVEALDNKDTLAIQTMRDDGRVFVIPRHTHLSLLSADGSGSSVAANISGSDLCSAEIESGRYIGSHVIIPCESVTPAK